MATRDIAELGIVVDARQAQAATRALDDLDSQGKKTAGSMKFLADTAKMLAAAFAAFKLVKLIEETALLNARFETMGVVMNVAGNNAGYTSAEMAALEKELTKTGISMIKARENLTSLATANIDLSKATKLARAAQDLAVVGNVNSSEAFSRLTQGIKSGEVEVLRSLGLNVNFENSYKKLASQLGTTSDKLTEQQKVQARTNATLEAASRYTGIYEESMGTAGKMLTSLSRYTEDLGVKIGAVFNEALTVAVESYTSALKDANAQTDALANNGSIDSFGKDMGRGLEVLIKLLLTFAAAVVLVLKTAGESFGATAAIFSAFFKGIMGGLNATARAFDALFTGGWGDSKKVAQGLSDALGSVTGAFKDAITIAQENYKTAGASIDAMTAYTGKLWEQTSAVKELTQEEIDQQKRKEAQRIAAGVAAREQDAADAKAAASREAAAKALKKMQEEAASFYKSTSQNSKDALVELSYELAGVEELTAAEKKRIEVLNELERLGKGLSQSQKDQITAQQDAIVFYDRLNTARKRDKKTIEELTQAAISDGDAARATTKSLEDQIKYYGLTADAVLRLQAAEYERKAFWAEADGNDIEVERLKVLQTETIKQADLQLKLNRMKAATTFWTGLEDAAHQTFLSIANGNKDLWTRLKETAKNIFFEWLYQQTVKKWIINVGMATDGAGAVSGIAGALGGSSSSGGAGGAFSTVGNLVSIGKTIYSGFSTGITSTLGGYVTQLGNVFGSQAVSAFGAGMQGGLTGAMAAAGPGATATTASAASAGASAASAIPIIGWIIAGMSAANGFAKQGFTPNNGTITNPLAQAFTLPTNFVEKSLGWLGMNKTLTNILSGAAINTKLFGRADPRVESLGLRGTIDANGVTATNYANIIEKGGLFRSSKRYEKSADVTGEADAGFDQTLKTIVDAVKGFGTALGIQTDVINGYTKSFDLKLTGDAAKDNEIIAKLFADTADELSLRLVPSLASFQAEGETLSATLQRLTSNYAAVDGLFASIGKTVGSVGVAGIAARENLIAAAGGLEALASGVAYFQQNFLTSSQQLAPIQKQVTDGLAAMGWSGIKTTEQFAAAGLAIDTSTEAGAKLFAQMLALAPAFKTVADAAAEQRDSLLDLQKQTADALGNTAASAAILEQQRAIALAKLSPELQEATKQLWAAQEAAAALSRYQQSASAQQAAAEEMSRVLAESRQRAIETAAAFRDLNTALLLGDSSTLSATDKYDVAKAAFRTAGAADLEAAQNAFLAASKALNDPLQYARDFAAVYARNQAEVATQTAAGRAPGTMFETSAPASEVKEESLETNTILRQVLTVVQSSDRYNKKTSDVLQGATRGGTALATENVSA